MFDFVITPLARCLAELEDPELRKFLDSEEQNL